MKKSIMALLVLGLVVLVIVGCQTAQQTTQAAKILDDSSALNYSQLGVDLSQGVTKSMVSMAQNGDVTSGIMVLGVKSDSIRSQADIPPDANGYYHLVTNEVNASLTYGADMHVKLVKDAQGHVIDIYLYGTISMITSITTNPLNLVMTYGNGTNPQAAGFLPYHGTTTWASNNLTAISANGPMSMRTVNQINQVTTTTSLTFNFTNYASPITAGPDYPLGSLTLNFSVNDKVSNYDITIAYNSTSVATMSYGDFTANLPLRGI